MNLTILKGFRCGMLLQLAVGPICLYIFTIANNQGLGAALAGVSAVTLVDASFILLAILGITSFLEQKKNQAVFKNLGAVIMGLFGMSIILGSFEINILPSIKTAVLPGFNTPFIKGCLLTAANPLTILFWAGIFSAQAAQERLEKNALYLFGLGAALSTLLFLSGVAVLGVFIKSFLTLMMMQFLNLLVGLSFFYFTFRILRQK